jgi:hypothetical protein
MDDYIRHTISKAKELLNLQSADLHVYQHVSQDEALRFLLHHDLNISLASQSLARRAVFKHQFVVSSPLKHLERTLPMCWAISKTKLTMVVRPKSQPYFAVSEKDVRYFVQYVGEAVARKSEVKCVFNLIFDNWKRFGCTKYINLLCVTYKLI